MGDQKEIDPVVRQSLEEIASLILLIHDYFLKETRGNDILGALHQFLMVAGLQSSVCILDAERLRRKVMCSSDDEMGCEQFYDWLRGVAVIVFPDYDAASSKKALHLLLTEYIVPFAAKTDFWNSQFKSESSGDFPYFTDSALKVFIEYKDLILQLFAEATDQDYRSSMLLPSKLWSYICLKFDLKCGVLGLYRVFTKYNLVPDLFLEEEFDSTLNLVGSTTDYDLDNSLTFNTFLYLLELLSESLKEERVERCIGSKSRGISNLEKILIVWSSRAFHRCAFEFSMLKKYENEESNGRITGKSILNIVQEAYTTAQISSPLSPGNTVVYNESASLSMGITCTSLLWWLRQSRLISVPHLQIPLVWEVLLQYAILHTDATIPTSTGHPEWIVGTVENVIFEVLVNVAATNLNQLFAINDMDSFDKLRVISKLFPTMLFARATDVVERQLSEPKSGAVGPIVPSDYSVVTHLRSLYSHYSVSLLRTNREELDALCMSFWDSVTATDKALTMQSESETSANILSILCTSMESVQRYFEKVHFVPYVVNSQELREVISYSLAGLIDSANVEDMQTLPFSVVFDALYLLVVVHWSALENLRRKKSISSSVMPRLSERQPQRAQQLLQTFLFLCKFELELACDKEKLSQNRKDLSLETELIESGEVMSAYVPLNSQGIENKISSADTISSPIRKPIQSRDSPWGVPHQYRDVMVLLAHYPLSSFELNPWSLMQMFTSLTESNSATFNFNRDNGLTELFRQYSEAFQVNSEDLARFFSQYYQNPGSPVLDVSTAKLDPAQLSRKLAESKLEVLRSPVLDGLLSFDLLRVLFLNDDLIKWEFARCATQYRVISNPFTSCMLIPFLSSDVITFRQNVAFISKPCAVNWAKHVVKISYEDAVDFFHQSSCLSGYDSDRLTFSTFVMFALRCFSNDGATNAVQSKVKYLESVRRMLYIFSNRLSEIQQELKMKVLKPLFGGVKEYNKDPNDVVNIRSIAVASMKYFSERYKSASAASGPERESQSSKPECRLPPRPPSRLWDAPRFIQFCRDLGLCDKFGLSIEICWVSFGVCTLSQNSSDNAQWERSVVSPMPVIATVETFRKLMQSLLWVSGKVNLTNRDDSVSSSLNATVGDETDNLSDFVSLYYKAFTPVLCAHIDNKFTTSLSPASDNRTGTQETPNAKRLEDYLRYGGSAMILGLSQFRPFLQAVYMKLQTNLEAVSIPERLAQFGGNSRLIIDNPEEHGEVPLNLICKFLGCFELLRPSAVAILAKHSLHIRIRPNVVVASSGSPSKPSAQGVEIEVVTMSYVEFEELFIRCAFLAWETSGAHSNAGPQEVRSALLNQGHLRGKDSSEVYKSTLRAAEIYSNLCDEQITSSRSGSSHESDSNKRRSSWGVDFVSTYGRLLEAVTDVSNLTTLNSKSNIRPLDLLKSYSSDTATGSAAVRNDTKPGVDIFQNVEKSELAEGTETKNEAENRIIDMFTQRFNYRIADPAIRRGEAESVASFPESIGESFETDSRGNPHGENHFSGGELPSAKPPTPSKQRVSISGQQRLLKMHESSESFVVALDTLLSGTKEALWPVYATYCSCSDSLDAGKLSGPNLFALLSKLGILTDQILLSDVGILFHQTAKHSLGSSALDAAAVMFNSGDYLDSPSLTFEEFIVFLCAFAHLRFEGKMISPEMFSKLTVHQAKKSRVLGISGKLQRVSSPNSIPENWLNQWQEIMASSLPFRRLLQECILPKLQNQTLLAFPDDARLRDRFCCIFSIEALLAIEGAEGRLQSFFETQRSVLIECSTENAVLPNTPLSPDKQFERSPNQYVVQDKRYYPFIAALAKLGIMSEIQVVGLIKDILPEINSRSRSRYAVTESIEKDANKGTSTQYHLLFSQWEWVLCIMALHSVDAALRVRIAGEECNNLPSLLADMITSIASAVSNNASKM